MRDHRKLRAFDLANTVAVLTYRITRTFPKDELYGLTSQMRRAAVSIPSNIVEGCARETQAEYLRFLSIAFGSMRELRYQLGLASELEYLDKKTYTECGATFAEAEQVLCALVKSVRTTLNPKP